MLPFLKNDKKVSGIILETRRTPDQKPNEPESDDSHAPLEACAEDILRAIASKDAKHLALALQAAYDICESAEPQEEESKHDYDAQAQD